LKVKSLKLNGEKAKGKKEEKEHRDAEGAEKRKAKGMTGVTW
jgi:hypothetical protein